MLRFTRPLAPAFASAAGTRMLIAFVIVGIGLIHVWRVLPDSLGVRGQPAGHLALVLVLLAAFFALQRGFVQLPLAAVGLRRYGDWTRRERLYLAQVVPVAALIFTIVFGKHLGALLERHGVGGFVVLSLLTGLLWGAVQEFVYRGWLQTELTRRFGANAGLIGANLAFTFGPLHLSLLSAPGGVRWDVLFAVFLIGLFFGLVYRRCGNLWLPAVLHGLWPPNMV